MPLTTWHFGGDEEKNIWVLATQTRKTQRQVKALSIEASRISPGRNRRPASKSSKRDAWHRAAWEQDYQAGREYAGGKTQHIDVKALEKDWVRFANLLGHRELAKLDKAGFQYRLPLPGARIIKGVLEVNTRFPGLVVEYSIDGGKRWQRYDDKLRPKVSGKVQVRTLSPDGNRVSRINNVKA